jgi:hypothetical protein
VIGCPALVRDADGSNIAPLRAGTSERFGSDGDLAGPDLLRVVFNPPGSRKQLLEFALRHGGDNAVVVEENRA